jgi:hypothetical protein
MSTWLLILSALLAEHVIAGVLPTWAFGFAVVLSVALWMLRNFLRLGIAAVVLSIAVAVYVVVGRWAIMHVWWVH